MPFYAILRQDALSLISLLASQPGLPVVLPPLAGGVGPPYNVPVANDPGLTSITVTSASSRSSFTCSTGQATFNPLSFAGVPAPDPADTTTWPSGATATLAEAIFTVNTVQQVQALSVCQSVSTCVSCTLANSLALPNGVTANIAVLLVSQFVCFNSFEQMARAASLAGFTARPLAPLSPRPIANR